MSATHVNFEEAAALFRPVDSIAVPLGPGQPIGLLHALGERTDWESFEVITSMLVDFYTLFDHPGVRHYSMFFGPIERMLQAVGRPPKFIPADFRRFGTVIEARAPRVVATMASPPDAQGWCSLSLHAGATVAELHRAAADPDRLLIVEASAAFPRTMGISEDHPHRLHVDEIDFLIASDRSPVVLADPPVSDVELAIAEYAAGFISEGSTLQTGFGSIPSTIATCLAERPGGHYGVHSEMFTTGLMRLHQAGKISNTRKSEFEGFSIATFAAGTEELYEWLDGRSDVRFAPVSVVNAPELIAANHNMVSINGAIAIDLFGQVIADTIGGHQYSGIGGHEDFVAGTGLELEDRSLLCLPSAVTAGDAEISRIVGELDSGSVVTTPRHQVDVVITEHGVAELRGRDVRERAIALAAIAHPSSRDYLRGLIEKDPRFA